MMTSSEQSMGRARSLLLAMNLHRQREEEERERRPGVRPGGERGVMIEMMGRGSLVGGLLLCLWAEVGVIQHQSILILESSPIPNPTV